MTLEHEPTVCQVPYAQQGRSQDFSVGTHSFPSHLFTPPPPPPKKKKIKVIFDSRVFYFKYININIFEIYFVIFFLFYLFIYLFIFLLLFSGTQLRICVQVATPLHSQQLPHVSCGRCGAGALIKRCFAPVLVVKGRLHKALGPISARQLCYMCMPMRPKKAETAVHGCHYLGQEPMSCLGDMAVRMPDHELVFERVTCFYCSKRITFLVDCVKCVSIPIIRTG